MRRVHSHLRFISTYANNRSVDTPSKDLLREYIAADMPVSSPVFHEEKRGEKYRQFEGTFGPIPDTSIELLNTKPVSFKGTAQAVRAINRIKNGWK